MLCRSHPFTDVLQLSDVSKLNETISAATTELYKHKPDEKGESSSLNNDSVTQRFLPDTGPQCPPNDICISSKSM